MRVAFLCVALLSTGCSTAYLPGGPASGYSETRLAPDSYQIAARTGSVERTGQVLELRAAELTLKNGYRTYVVVDHTVTTEQHAKTGTIAKGKMTIRMLKEADSSGTSIDASAVRARLQPMQPLLIGVAGG
jgi:hypothetical protein